MTIIGDAYVDVKARTEGFESGAESLFGGFGAKAAVAFAAAFAAAGAVTKVLYDIGASFDDAFDTIRVGTGKTGESLKAMEASFKRVAASGPESFDQVSSTITTLSQKLGLTGKPLEDLSRQFLDLSHITKSEVGANVKAVTDVFNNFGVAAKDQGPKLDELFRATQQSGLGITDLASQMSSTGVQMRALGLTFEDSTAIIAGLAKEGLSTADVLPALNKTLAVAAKGGKDAGTAFRDVIASIKDAPSATAASGIALQAFGARGAKMAELIREGKLSFDDLKMSIVGGSDTISKATKDTADFSEKFATFKNRVLIGLEPIATKVFNALGDGMDRLAVFWKDNGPQITAAVQDFGAQLSAAFAVALPVIQEVVGWVQDHLTPILIGLGAAALLAAGPVLGLAAAAVYAYTHFEGFRDVVGKVMDWLTNVALPAVSEFASYLIASFGDAVRWVQQYWPQISEAIGHVMRVIKEVVGAAIDFVTAVWGAWGDDLKHIVMAVWTFIGSYIEAAVKMVQGVIKTVVSLINGDWGKAWDGIKQILAGVWDQIAATVRLGIDTLRAVLGGAVSALGAIWSGLWDKIKLLAIGGWNAMVDWIKGGGLLSLAAFFLDLPAKISGFFTDIIKRLFDLGVQIMEGLKNGIVDGAKAVLNAVKDAVTAPWDWATNFVESHSPSKKWARLGAWTMQGYLDGLKSKSADITAWMAALLRNMVTGAQTAISGIRAAFSVRDAQASLTDAQKARSDLLARQALLPSVIAKQVDLVAAERAKAKAIDPAEQLNIDRAQQTVIDKTKALTDARADGQHTALELRIMTEELQQAQADLTTAQKDAVGPTDALTQAEADLKDLRDEQHAMTDKLTQANHDLESAELAVVEAQGQLASSSADLAQNPGAINFFKQLAEQAGLTSAAIQQLVADLNGTSTAVSGPRAGSVPGSGTGPDTRPIGPGGKQPTLPGWDLAAGTGPNGIRFTPGGGGLPLSEIQKIVAGIDATPHTTVVAPVNFNSIDTKGLLEKMNVKAAVGEAVTSATRLRPVTP